MKQETNREKTRNTKTFAQPLGYPVGHRNGTGSDQLHGVKIEKCKN